MFRILVTLRVFGKHFTRGHIASVREGRNISYLRFVIYDRLAHIIFFRKEAAGSQNSERFQEPKSKEGRMLKSTDTQWQNH